MKNFLKISLCLFTSINAFAQTATKATYKQSFSGADKKIFISSGIDNLIIEGTSGTEVILESDKDERNFPAEAEGLKLVTFGAVDNTGIGANVTIEGNIMKIKIPKVKSYKNFVLKIPNEISINVAENGNKYAKWQISNMKGDVETKTSFSTLNINNVSGPIVAHGGYGKIYIVYDQLNQGKPNSISSSGAIDITLPTITKANLKLQARYGEVFSDFDILPLKAEPAKTLADLKDDKSVKTIVKDNQIFYVKDGETYDRFGKKVSGAKTISGTGFMSPDDVVNQNNWATTSTSDDCNCTSDGASLGIINGGGVSLSIKSDYGNIYLRKKK